MLEGYRAGNTSHAQLCLNLYQLTASQQNTDHVANMQVTAWEKSSNLNCCNIVFLKGRMYLYYKLLVGAWQTIATSLPLWFDNCLWSQSSS